MRSKGKLLVIGVLCLLLVGALVAGCDSGVSQEDYDAAVAERDAAQAEVDELESEVDDLEAEVADCEAEIADLEAQIQQMTPAELPELLSVVDEFESLMTAADRDAQIVAFGDLSTAIEEIGDDDLNALLREVVTQGMVSDEASAVAMVDMAAHMLSVCAASVEAFPAEVQPMLELADEIEAVIAAEDVAAQTAAFGELSAAVSAIGNDDLSAKLQAVITGGMESELAGNMAIGGMISWILMQAAEAAQ
jgi:polyhydroxyalkanoate synthesis regulator phasin